VLRALAAAFGPHAPEGVPYGIYEVSPGAQTTIRFTHDDLPTVVRALVPHRGSDAALRGLPGVRFHPGANRVPCPITWYNGAEILIDPAPAWERELGALRRAGQLLTGAVAADELEAYDKAAADAPPWSTALRRIGLVARLEPLDYAAAPPDPAQLAGPHPERVNPSPCTTRGGAIAVIGPGRAGTG